MLSNVLHCVNACGNARIDSDPILDGYIESDILRTSNFVYLQHEYFSNNPKYLYHRARVS